MTESIWDHENANCNVGNFKIDRVVDLERLSYPYGSMIPDADPKVLSKLAEEMGSRLITPGTLDLSLSFHSFLIRSHKYTILVDTCCGNGKNRPNRVDWHLRDGPFLNNLSARGVKPEDVDIVMCTHLHADHVGWNTIMDNGDWVPTFPNAQYLFAESEYDFWIKEQKNSSSPILLGSYEDSVLPIMQSGQGKLVDSNYQIETGLNFEPAYGHTPGSIILHVEEGGREAIVCGDVMHHPVQVRYPNWSSAFCEDPILSAKYRWDMLTRFSGTGAIILPAHFLSPFYGPIEKERNGFRTII
ncbi:MAG: MBL fold metallo-hydrolase [Rhodospirillaceae bacterium]|nr:MBL fold metallo-hydrolase [Rhodospirillaceae bacterium]